MGLIEQAKKDSELINSDLNGFAVNQTWKHPVTSQILTIQGRHTKHHLGFNELGQVINTKNASATFSEKIMTDNGYSIRDASGEVNLKNHLVEIKDSTNTLYKYKVSSFLPDEVLGMIVCILEAYE